MSDFTIKNASFVMSYANKEKPPVQTNMEIAMVGRSNVGKSSLINCICNNSKLARTSSTPGKTRQINFFSVNKGEFYLVDLPGYGFAKAPKGEKAAWGELMETYLSSGRLTHIFLLLDIRHEPSQEDRQMFDWIVYYGIPFTVIATKADKLPKSKQRQSANKIAKQVGAPPFAIPFSSESKIGKEEVIARLGSILDDIKERGSESDDNTENSSSIDNTQ